MFFLSRLANMIEALGRVHRLLPWVIAYALLLPLPWIMTTFFNEYLIDLANRACLFILLAVGLNIVKGFLWSGYGWSYRPLCHRRGDISGSVA